MLGYEDLVDWNASTTETELWVFESLLLTGILGLIILVALDLLEEAESTGVKVTIEELEVAEIPCCLERLRLSDAIGMPVEVDPVEAVGYTGLFETAKVLGST